MEEAKCQASVEKLEQAKARAEAAIARDAAIASEAIAQALKQKVMDGQYLSLKTMTICVSIQPREEGLTIPTSGRFWKTLVEM